MDDAPPRPEAGVLHSEITVAAPTPTSAGVNEVTAAGRTRQLARLVECANRLAVVSDLEAVLEAVTDTVMDVLEPPACAIDLLDHSSGRLGASLACGLSPELASWWRDSGRDDVATRIASTSRPNWPAADHGLLPAHAKHVPLTLPDQPVLGMLTLFTHGDPELTAWSEEIVHSIVTQTVAALSRSRVRLRDVMAVYTVAQTITGRIELQQLSDAVLGAIAGLFSADSGVIVLAEPGGVAAPALLATHGAAPPVDAAHLLAQVTQSAEPIVLTTHQAPTTVASGLQGRWLAAPLLLDRKLLGALVLGFSRAQFFRQSDLWLLSAVASQVTMALRNAQLYLWSEELAIAEERSRLAREIHDGLAQSLALKIVKLEYCRKLIDRDHTSLDGELHALQASVRADIQDVRHSILALRPLDLEHRGLSEAVLAYMGQFSHDTGIAIDSHVDHLDGLPPKVQTALFRLVQEALNNIRKHAHAASATVRIGMIPSGAISLYVADSGRGFDVDAALKREPGQTGIGLRGMIERATAAGGTIDIASTPGQGATISITLPAH